MKYFIKNPNPTFISTVIVGFGKNPKEEKVVIPAHSFLKLNGEIALLEPENFTGDLAVKISNGLLLKLAAKVELEEEIKSESSDMNKNKNKLKKVEES